MNSNKLGVLHKNKFIKEAKDLRQSDVNLAGGKGASLGEMVRAGIVVPSFFVITSSAFDEFIGTLGLADQINNILNLVDYKNNTAIQNASDQIRSIILNEEMPIHLKKEIKHSFGALKANRVAVRSSATAEDDNLAAWAGQLTSYLNTTEESLLINVQKCWASLFTPQAIYYRFARGMHKQNISVAVVVQTMIDADVSGVAFSVHPVTQDKNQLIIEAGWGLGEAIVSGQITPDSYIVVKNSKSIVSKKILIQDKGLYYSDKNGNEWRDISKEKGEKQCLSNSKIIDLSEIVIKIENHYGFPCDIEWAIVGDKIWILQSRPITTLNN